MSSFVWMKFLESTPERYDRGIRMLSGGRIDAVHRRIAELAASPGARVLDIGCGTGGVALACAARGATVLAIDLDAGMLEVARRKPVPAGGRVEWLELGVAEIGDRVPAESLDAVVSCLAFSELSPDEQDYALRMARESLRPGGVLVIADEVVPRTRARRVLHRLARLPVALGTFALTQTTTRPLLGLAERVRAAGFEQVSEARMWSDTFAVLDAVRSQAPS